MEDSDSERELVIDLGEEQGGKDKKKGRRDNTASKESSAGKPEGEICFFPLTTGRNAVSVACFSSQCDAKRVKRCELDLILFHKNR